MKRNTYSSSFNLIIAISILLLGIASQAEKLKWAADTESGAPFVFYESEDLNKMTGYEYEIVQSLAKKLNAEPEFVQNAWDGLILGLNNNLYQIAINGLEITDERKKVVNFSIPYYATYLQIVTRQGETRFKKLSDLSGFKVGTLAGALSESVLRAQPGIEVVTYDSETLAHQDLTLTRTDALLFDAPIAKYYSEISSKFQVIETPISSMTYGIAISKNNPELLLRVNKALEEMIESGELKAILARWSLWNNSTATLFNDFSPNRTPPTSFEKYKSSLNLNRTFSEKLDIYKKSIPLLKNAVIQTIRISFTSMLLAVLLGLIITLARQFNISVLNASLTFLVEVIRGTPLLLQLFFIFYALPSLGIEISAFWAAVCGLGINYSAQESEIYRAGLNSVHRNQIEAAKLLGLSKLQTFFYIQIPQAFKFSLPPMTNDFIALIKDSSLVSVITLVELTKTFSLLSATYYDYVGFAVITAGVYILIGLPLVILSKFIESKAVKIST